MEKINFTAGPSILPKEVTEALAQATLNYNDSGLSLLEISHRSDTFMEIIEEAQQLVRDLLKLPSNYEVLFLSGGSTTQFALAPYNLLPNNGSAGYLDTGTWSTKAINAAEMYGLVDVCASSHDKNYNYIPRDYRIDPDWTYVHLTSNNTIYGTQINELPDTGDVPIVIDMCSDIFSKKIENIERFGMIYASAQKNLGPAGTTLVIINKDLLGKTGRDIPDAFNYQKHIAKKSVLNTPPVYAIYGCLIMLRWLKKKGLNQIERRNTEKSKILYDEIDNNPNFIPHVRNSEDRSVMNITFTLAKPTKEKAFDVFAENHGFIGFKGHRSVGGYRASLYNAMEKGGAEKFVKMLRDFSWRFGG